MGMSREEAKEQSLDITGYSDSYELIDEIYDDFESRICDNCKYFTFENTKIGTCRKGIYDKQLCSSEDYLVSTFGCNKWEKI